MSEPDITDIVYRLKRNAESEDCFNDPYPDVLLDAAEEITCLRAERDEWRRRAEQQRDFMKDTLVDEEYGDQWAWDYFVQLYPEAAQWFEEES